MATYPKYDFNDPDLNYDDVFATTIDMYSDLNAQKGCCVSKGLKDTFSQANTFITLASFDKDNLNMERYKSDVKSAYLLLYSKV